MVGTMLGGVEHDHRKKAGAKGQCGSCWSLAWHRAGTGLAKELEGTQPPARAERTRQSGELYGRTLPSQQHRPVALHTHSYTYVFSRLQYSKHRTQLQRTFCEGLHGAPPAEPNAAFYSELDERLHLQHSTLAAVRARAGHEHAAAHGLLVQGGGDDPESDTMALRQAVNSSLSSQMHFFTGCMARYCLDGDAAEGATPYCRCRCGPGCECVCRVTHDALAGAAYA